MSVATAYAKALYEAARDTGVTADTYGLLESEMDQFIQILDSSREARVVLLGPTLTPKERTATIDEISKRAGFHVLTQRFLSLLAQKQRLTELKSIRESFATVRLEAEGAVLGRIVSADPMAEEDVATLSQAFGKKLGKRVAFRRSTDPALIAGMKVTVNGVTYDGTLRAQLQQLRDRMVWSTSTR